MSAFALTAGVIHQIGALDEICCAEGGPVTCVKPHGARYDTLLAAVGRRVELLLVAGPDPARKDEG